MKLSTLPLQKVPGFESTAYAYLDGNLVWAGESAGTDIRAMRTSLGGPRAWPATRNAWSRARAAACS